MHWAAIDQNINNNIDDCQWNYVAPIRNLIGVSVDKKTFIKLINLVKPLMISIKSPKVEERFFIFSLFQVSV